MEISLAYIRGINRIDTPSFSNLAQQSSWFDNTDDIITINSTFYPPHYKNRIRLDIEDVDFTATINYLWFTFRGKRYYYFIDDVEYINENIVELVVTMDYIQTYMFNIIVNNGIIERRFINRWKRNSFGNIINRDYLRENVSGGLFEKGNKQQLLSGDLILVLKVAGVLGTHITSSTDPYLESPPDQGCTNIYTKQGVVSSPFLYYFIFPSKFTTLKVIDTGNTYTNNPRLLSEYLGSPNVLDGYLVPIELFSELFSIDGNDDTMINLFSSYGNKPCLASVSYLVTELFTYNAVCFVNKDNVRFSSIIPLPEAIFTEGDINLYSGLFLKNSNIGELFNSKYMPIMLDENYIYDRFGTDSANIDNPTHYLLQPRSTYVTYCNIDDGSLVFSINATSLIKNSFDTTVIDTNIVSQELNNDPWKEYVANNKNRWSSAGMQAGLAAVDTFVSVATGTLFATKGIDRVLKDKRSYTKKKQQMKVGVQRHLSRMGDDLLKSTIEDASSGIAGIAKPLISQAITDSNMQQAPHSIKQTGRYEVLNAFDRYMYAQLYKVRDYEQCANYFHRNGYHVEQYVNNDDTGNIFLYIESRYYFDILKFSDLSLSLLDSIADDNTIEGIKDRLLDGVRLWHVNNPDVYIGDYTFDNVENAYVS